ncbi:MAG: NUDIX domain-containing protein [Nocardioides sp.]
MTRFASVLVVDARGWVLLQERDEHPVIDPEKWGFCGGHLEAGEGYDEGAYRELEEETGLRLAAGALLPVGDFTVFHEHSQTDDSFRLYAVQLDLTDDDVECHEGRQIVFVDPEEARGLDLTAAARIALPGFLDSELYARLRA